MSSTVIGKDLIDKWKGIKGRDAKNDCYFMEVRPAVTGVLRSRFIAGVSSGRIKKYKNMALILGHDANPLLITIGAVRPEAITVFYTERSAKQLEKRFIPVCNKEFPECAVRPVKIDYTGHEENYRIFLKELDVLKKNGETICDITGGKKISSSYMALISSRLGIDFCYLDASNYTENSATPEPGSEALYIHRGSDDNLFEISTLEEKMLIINSSRSDTILYNFVYNGCYTPFKKTDLSDSVYKSIRESIEAEYGRIDHAIRLGQVCTSCFDELAGIVRSMLLTPALEEALKNSGGGDIKLVVEPSLSGIPWELLLEREYGADVPVIGKLQRSSVNPSYIQKESSGILILSGNCEGIEGIDEFRKHYISYLQKAGVNFEEKEAADRGSVQRIISRKQYKLIIYSGHSEFDKKEEKTGWRCTNGELFRPGDFEALRNTASEMIISNSCHSARSVPFNSNSIACKAIENGVNTFIGTRWFLEYEKSIVFLNEITRNLLLKNNQAPEVCFRNAMQHLRKKYGPDDVSLYNYIFYS